MARPKYVMTVRQGARIERNGFDDLDEAIATLREEAESIRVRGRIPPATTPLGDFPSEEIVSARLEISSRGILRGRTVGVDVMGGGEVVPYEGSVVRDQLDYDPTEGPYEAVRRALGG